MPDFLLRDLPEDLMVKLRARAERSGRSLQAEIHETLRASVPMSWDEFAREATLLRARMRTTAPTTRGAIDDEHGTREGRRR